MPTVAVGWPYRPDTTSPKAAPVPDVSGVGVRAAVAALHRRGFRVVLNGLGAVATHTFAFLCMGVIVAAMMIRISQGHTGRALVFTGTDRAGLAVLGLAAFFRLVAPQLWPAHYLAWITLAGLGWASCFAVLGARLVPYLWRARIDGKEH